MNPFYDITITSNINIDLLNKRVLVSYGSALFTGKVVKVYFNYGIDRCDIVPDVPMSKEVYNWFIDIHCDIELLTCDCSKILRNIKDGWTPEAISNCLRVLDVSIPTVVYNMEVVGQWWEDVKDTDERYVLDWLLEHNLVSEADKREIADSNFGTKFSCYGEIYPEDIINRPHVVE